MQQILAVVLLLALSPLLLIVYLLVKLTSKGEFIFRQKRIGKDFKPFTIYKIRTMVDQAEKLKSRFKHLNEADGPVFKIKNDPRFTKFGRFLASTGFDEVLQLINVIKGDMSFVGPRPLPVSEAKRIPPKFRQRFSLNPGITSLWVIRGTHDLTFTEWMESDLEYLKNKSLLLDISIVLITGLLMFKWLINQSFLLIFPLVLLFYALFPDVIWWSQIYIFFSFFIFLGLNFRNRPPLILLILLLLLYLSTYFSIDRISSQAFFFSYILVILLFTTFEEKNKENVLQAYVLGALIIGAVSTFYSLSKIFYPDNLTILSIIEVDNNLIIPYFGQAFYGIFLIATLPYVFEKITSPTRSFLWSLVFLLYIIFLLMTFSKLAVIVGFLQISFMLYLKYKEILLIRKLKILYLTLLTIISLCLYLLLRFQHNPWFAAKIYKSTIPSRLEYWQQSLKIIKNSSWQRIFLGHGLDTFYNLSHKFQSRPGYWSRYAHNFLLQFFIENGLLASIVLIYFMISKIRSNFSRYLLFEKVTLFSLLLYSLGSPADLSVFPVLLLFFIIIGNHKIKDFQPDNQKGGLSLVTIGLVGVLLIYWFIYIYFSTSFFISGTTTLKQVKLFPYEPSFWAMLIHGSKNEKNELLKIKEELNNYSSVNLELSRILISKIQEKGDYCLLLSTSSEFLSLVPYDLEMQDKFMESYNNCENKNEAEYLKYFNEIKYNFDTSWENLAPMKTFLKFMLIYYLEMHDFEETNWWFNKLSDYEGDVYFRYASALKESRDFAGVNRISLLCQQKFDFAHWCDDIINLYLK